MKLTRKLVAAAATAVVGLAAGSAQAVVSANNPANWVLNPGAFGGAFDGVAKLLFSNASGNFVCSGSLLQGGQYVLTAAHCADDYVSMTADFKLGAVTRTVVESHVLPGWAGFNNSAGNGSDIAILKLNAPVAGVNGFKLSGANDMGKNILAAGYGLVGTGLTGGTGFDRPNSTTWRPHYGYNTIDATDKQLQDALFGAGSGSNQYGETYVFDFDDGNPLHNALQRLKGAFGGAWADSSLGLGDNEALIAGGDSGGGDFYFDGTDWLLTGVHSYGWGVCGQVFANCDVLPGTNSSFGDLSGSTAVFSHVDWINGYLAAAVPEPETYALMLAGLAALGWVSRRRATLSN